MCQGKPAVPGVGLAALEVGLAVLEAVGEVGKALKSVVSAEQKAPLLAMEKPDGAERECNHVHVNHSVLRGNSGHTGYASNS